MSGRNVPLDITSTITQTEPLMLLDHRELDLPGFSQGKLVGPEVDAYGYSYDDDVTWNGISYPGHWSWIYVARHDPYLDGTHIWRWMAAQRAAV